MSKSNPIQQSINYVLLVADVNGLFLAVLVWCMDLMQY
uniref:Uncharacterized protein n=1 Tax=Arundo donax TaxID=35708 RepID=A0A0A9FWT5_ARUDO